MKKTFYIFLFVTGIILTIYSSINWGLAGFPFSISELSMSIFGTRPWHLEKDSYFLFIILGLFVSAYALFEINLKRWEQ